MTRQHGRLTVAKRGPRPSPESAAPASPLRTLASDDAQFAAGADEFQEPAVDRRRRLLRHVKGAVATGRDDASGLHRDEPRYARGSFRRGPVAAVRITTPVSEPPQIVTPGVREGSRDRRREMAPTWLDLGVQAVTRGARSVGCSGILRSVPDALQAGDR
jgi:hypothetical protein